MTPGRRGAVAARPFVVPVVLPVVLLVVLLLAPFAPAFAGGQPEEGAPAPRVEGSEDVGADPREPAREGPLTLDEMADLMSKGGASWLLGILIVFGGVAWGIVAAVLLLVHDSRVRAGEIPPWPRAPPTEPFGPFHTVGVIGAALLLGILVQAGILAIHPGGREDLTVKLLGAAAIFLPLAAVVIVRRRRLRGPHRLPRRRVLLAAAMAWGVAMLLVIPANLASFLVAKLLGFPLHVYGLLEEVAVPSHPSHPWLIAFFAVLVAPVTEESVYRGLLYPVARRLAGGTARGAWTAAIIVSAMFAASHMHALSFPGLFVLAVLLSRLMERTNSLVACILAHAVFNACTLLPHLVRHLP